METALNGYELSLAARPSKLQFFCDGSWRIMMLVRLLYMDHAAPGVMHAMMLPGL